MMEWFTIIVVAGFAFALGWELGKRSHASRSISAHADALLAIAIYKGKVISDKSAERAVLVADFPTEDAADKASSQLRRGSSWFQSNRTLTVWY